jgi:hypothetical protein
MFSAPNECTWRCSSTPLSAGIPSALVLLLLLLVAEHNLLRQNL